MFVIKIPTDYVSEPEYLEGVVMNEAMKMDVQPKYSQNEVLEKVINILMDGLKYAEFDGHDMPKRPVRNALIALGVPEDKQP